MDAHERQQQNAERAVRAYRALVTHLGVLDTKLLRESTPGSTSGHPFAYIWPFEEAVKATLYLTGLPGIGEGSRDDLGRWSRGRERYWDARGRYCLSRRPSYASYVLPPLGQGGDTFLDDNTWVALDMIQQHRMFGDRAVLDRAALVAEFVWSGWAEERTPHPGGLYWVDARWNRDRGASTNLGAAALMLHLHELTTPATMEYLDRAHRLYDWARAALLATAGPTAGLYHDKILGDGSLDPTQWAYNQGNAVAAGVMLHRATGDRRYLDEARVTARAALAYYAGDRLMAQPAIFVAILFRTLLQLPPSNERDRARAAMHAYADRVRSDPSIHDARTDLFRIDPATPNVTLLDQAAVVQLFALLAWPEAQYGLLA